MIARVNPTQFGYTPTLKGYLTSLSDKTKLCETTRMNLYGSI